jgi:ACS family sodium-dependent inorganic phosphate cotransporter
VHGERPRFDWDEETQGEVLSAFYYGYILTHLPGGVLSQKYGGKHTMGFGILCTAIFTLMTPFVAHIGSRPLTILRFIEGLGEVTRTIMIFSPLSSVLRYYDV